MAFDVVMSMFGLQGEPWTTLIVSIVFIIILFIFFAKAITTLSGFSTNIGIFIALALSIIGVITGLTPLIVKFLAHTFGFIGASLILLLLFVSYFIFQALIDRALSKQKSKREKIDKEAAEKMFKTIGKEITRTRGI